MGEMRQSSVTIPLLSHLSLSPSLLSLTFVTFPPSLSHHLCHTPSFPYASLLLRFFHLPSFSFFASSSSLHLSHLHPPSLSPTASLILSRSPQSFLASSAGSDCNTLYSAPIQPDDIEPHLWWPNGVGNGKPTLIKCNITSAILNSVC